MLPALWAIGHYVYFWLTGQVSRNRAEPGELLDTPVRTSHNTKWGWSIREILGRVLLTLLLAPVVLIFVLIVVGGLLSLMESLQ
ncbi:hypothetical protein [Neolewinella agarilytica]|uniref:Uncharacterized protein n=1 Tax=Neolewinella agarilytica TaxID=478744 RepID=A0A1H8ZD17_9BACT|nr:hypothetical protein [Neolewinella agarilytica]SEP62275.1 hypothetical protein SAMN05444359_101275 [Neolewinella agarilytica]